MIEDSVHYREAPEHEEDPGHKGGPTDRFIDSIVFVGAPVPGTRVDGDDASFTGVAYCDEVEFGGPSELFDLPDEEFEAIEDCDICAIYPVLVNDDDDDPHPLGSCTYVAAERCRLATKDEVLSWLRAVQEHGKEF